MATAFLTAFNTLVENVKSNPLVTFLTFLVFIASYLAISNGAKLDSLMPPSPEEERAALQQTLVSDAEVEEALVDVRLQSGADRVLVRQFSNGKRNIAGVPWSYISTTHFSVRKGVSHPSGDRYPTASMNHSLRRMWADMRNPSCLINDTDEMPSDASYDNYLDEHGVVKFAMCPVISLGGYPIGFIGIGFLDKSRQKMSDEEIIALMESKAIRIAGYLNEVEQASHAETRWYQLW